MKIKWHNFKLWLKDQFGRKNWFKNFFITRNAWAGFSINSHINQSTGKPKIAYSTKESAIKAANKMSEKTSNYFSNYKCLFCDGYHIGKHKK